MSATVGSKFYTAIGIALLVLASARGARAANPARSCTAEEKTTFCRGKQLCNTVSCRVDCLAGTWPGCAEPDIPVCTVNTPFPAGQACTDDSNPCTTDACDGAGTCAHTNATGGKVCGASCIPSTMCCVDADCPADPANHRTGVCAATGCAYTCEANYKPCGGTCIPVAQCCGAGECTVPPNGCYKTAGTCNAGTCAYALNNGAACNADNDACTPNDKCDNGTCVADTAHAVVCLQRECHSAPTCNKTTGNCDDTALTGACGGNGCTPAGTCAAGACSTAAMTKDCSAQNAMCKVGACNLGTGDCAAVNKANGVACTLTDKCYPTPACNGGECVGERKTCSVSGACRVAECNGASGECEETVAPVGTSCAAPSSCVQNAACDAVGNCVGGAIADGSPCDLPGCIVSAACQAGVCACLQGLDFGTTVMEGSDMGIDTLEPSTDGGCEVAGGRARSGWGFFLIGCLGVLTLARRRRLAATVVVAATLALLPSRAEALPTCATLNCPARNYTDACSTHRFFCINEGGGLIYCEEDVTAVQPGGTPCTNDNNPCTTDVCGSYVYMGVTYGNGVCGHAALPAGSACTDDGNACTSDTCSGSTCTHTAMAGAACSSDGNPCTTDTCDGTAACTHTNATGGSVCGAACIPPGTCCDNPNSCTGGRTCPGAGGSCGCPGGTFDCAGSCIANGTCCNSPNTCTGGKACSGVGGSCSCPGGTYDCAGTCIANGTCCNNPNNCSAPANGAGVCSGPGGSCSFTCNGGYKACGAVCIPNATCCTDGDCPSDAANNRHGICTASGCAYACDSGFRACGATCITLNACCGSSECVNPTNGCYKTQGTCSSGTCTYAYNDGAACNADNDACTPNDKCKTGACVADTANAVMCLQRECHTAPTCNKTTGNCDDTEVTGACGGNGCTPAGTCAGGACSTAAQTKDCTAQNAVCKVGACNIATGDCAAVNKANATTCTLADKCIPQPTCNGGECVGTRVECAPSGACRVAECNGTTGECEETVAPVGTSCSSIGSCMQNSICDATGNCTGSAVADGSPCDNPACTASACSSGKCVCLQSPDFGSKGDEQTSDMSVTTMMNEDSGNGCELAGGRRAGWPWSFMLVLIAVVTLRGQRRARR